MVKFQGEVFVAFLDILGFKDLITKNEEDLIAKLFNEVSAKSRRSLETQLKLSSLLFEESEVDKVEALSISDSLVIWTHRDSIYSFSLIAAYVKSVLGHFMDNGVPLRGAITRGPICVTEAEFANGYKQTNVFGKGIVRAYTLEDQQQWSGCIIDPTCVEHLKKTEQGRSLVESYSFVEYEVPLKRGDVVPLTALNWTAPYDVSWYENGEKIRESFAMHNKCINDWSVKVKIENTIKFYNDMMKRSRHLS